MDTFGFSPPALAHSDEAVHRFRRQADHLSERSDAGVRLCRSVIGLGQWRLHLSHRISFELEFVGVVDEPVEDGVGEGGVAEQVVPLLDGKLAGDQGGTGGVSVLEELEEVSAMVGVERGESEVVEDDEVDFGERGQQLGIGAVAAGDGDVVQQPWESQVQGVIARFVRRITLRTRNRPVSLSTHRVRDSVSRCPAYSELFGGLAG